MSVGSRCCGRVRSVNNVIQRFEKTLCNSHTTTQKRTNNGFHNTKKHPAESRKPFVHLCRANDHRNLLRPFFVSGMWYSILEFLNVAGVVTNSFLVAFTSSYGRSWEGDPTTSSRTELVFNSTSNATDQVVIITEHLAGPSRLWLIIGFEVSLSIRRGQHLHFQSLHLYPIFTVFSGKVY